MKTAPDFPALAVPELSLRLVETENELCQAQRLRYQIFCEELGAKTRNRERLDHDEFDSCADHLLVVNDQQQVVATTRLTRNENLAGKPFSTENEYDIAKLRHGFCNITEIGRSCIAAPYRRHQVMDALWKGIAIYVHHYDIEILFGCASFPGVDIARIARELSYLGRQYLAPDPLRVKALPERLIALEQMPETAIDSRDCIRLLPPLIRGYLGLGAVVGEGAVIDTAFNTIDICTILDRSQLKKRYRDYYQRFQLAARTGES